MATSDYDILLDRYLIQIERIGIDDFELEVLKPLYELEQSGEVTNTSTLDESTTVRRSVYPIEVRIQAAEMARKMFLTGEKPGPKAVSLNFGGWTNLR